MGARGLPVAAPMPAATASNFAACIPVILAAEGGFVDDPRDPGGATNHGITQRTLAAWRQAPVTTQQVRALDATEAAAIYRAQYWAPLGCDALPRGVDLMVFDFGVNAGPARSLRLLQRAVGALPDGTLGPATLAKLRAADPRAVIETLAALRLEYYRALPGFATFGRGWTSRVAAIRRQALLMR